MTISQIAIRRIAEDKAAEDGAYRRKIERNGRPLTCHVRRMTDDELVAKLHALGLDIDRVTLDEASRGHLAAYQLANTLLDQSGYDGPDSGKDWAWFSIETLWQRWLPERSNLEMVDDAMQAGYAAVEQQKSVEACRQWRHTWLAILDLMQRFQIRTIADFDEQFGGTQCVLSWVQDYELELHNAGLDDAQFFHDRIALCQTVIERFGNEELPTDGFRSALAQSYAELGQRDTGDRLFRQWLDEDPRWGWGWIAWSDCYFLCASEMKDADRALQILHQGLAVAGVHDRKQIMSRLESILAETGREDEAASIRRMLEQEETEATDDPGIVQDTPPQHQDQLTSGLRQRVGRNDSCPCGSGKKFKKCCGRRS